VVPKGWRPLVFRGGRSGWVLTKKVWTVVRSRPSLVRLPLTGGALAVVVFVVVGIPGALLADGGLVALLVVPVVAFERIGPLSAMKRSAACSTSVGAGN
jgi:hypothetical protein